MEVPEAVSEAAASAVAVVDLEVVEVLLEVAASAVDEVDLEEGSAAEAGASERSQDVYLCFDWLYLFPFGLFNPTMWGWGTCTICIHRKPPSDALRGSQSDCPPYLDRDA